MKKSIVMTLLVMLTFGMQVFAAQDTMTPKAMDNLRREIRHELVMLPFYSVFDNFTYRMDGGVVTLEGQVTRPTLKSDAEKAVQRIEGVTKVVNNIEVLPLSTADDAIRLAAYRALFAANSPLMRYGLGSVPSIHIIVKGGRVNLVGEVDNEGDKTIASSLVRNIPGTFEVTNNLSVRKASAS